MLGKNRQNYLVPDYVLSFECAQCTECCKRWRINIDKKAVDQYKQFAAEDAEFALLLEKGLKINKTGTAVIRFKDEQKKISVTVGGEQQDVYLTGANVCPFLDEKGLCIIQKRFGLKALSDTCKIFPRIINKTERGYEMALSYACVTAANTLKQKNPVEFYMNPPNFDFPATNCPPNTIGDILERTKVGKTNYFEVEELLIDIMQFREIDIDTRLVLAGVIIDKLKDGDLDGIRKYLRNLDQALFEQLEKIPSQPVFMMKMVKEAIDKRLLTRIPEANMMDLLKIAFNQLGLLNEAIISENKVQRLLDGYNKYYKPYTGDVSHVWENYFVNFIFSKKFYSYKYIDAYFLLIFFYTLIRFFSICSSMVAEKEIDEDMVVGVINAIERTIGHNVSFYKDVLLQIKRGRYHRLPFVLSLVNL